MDKTNQEKSMRNERGELMIESMIVVVITLFVLIWLLGLGFLYYQRYVAEVVTNDAAVKIASTYNNPTSDIIMGYVTTEELSNRDLYRGFTIGSYQGELLTANKRRAEEYVKYKLDQMNFVGTVESAEVNVDLVLDSASRKHVVLTTVCTFNTPFGEGLELFGMDSQITYEFSAYADCTDIADYISVTEFGSALIDGRIVKESGFVTSLIGMLDDLVAAYNQFQS